MLHYKEEIINCPLCGAEPEKHKLFLERGRNGRYFIEIDEHLFNDKHVFCESCGLIFINPRMTPDSLERFYKEKYRSIYSSENLYELELLHAKFREQFLIQSKYLIGEKKLLDVGSSTGAFPFLMKRHGVDIDSVEPSEEHCTIAEDMYSVCHYNTIIEHYETDKKYDIITMFDAFEHLADPKDFLEKAYELLTDDGVLYLELPTIYLPRSLAIGFFSAAHTFSYSEATLGYMLEKHGFYIDYIDHQGHRRDLRIIAKKSDTKRSDFPRKDDFKFIFHLWNSYTDVVTKFFPNLQNEYSYDSIKKILSDFEGSCVLHIPIMSHAAAFHLSNSNLDDAMKLYKDYFHLFTTEDAGVFEIKTNTMLAFYNHKKRNFHAAYNYLNKIERKMPRIHEIENLPEKLDKNYLLKIIKYDFNPALIYKMLDNVSTLMGQHAYKDIYKENAEFYSVE